MKPIVPEGDYIISIFDANDDEVKQIHVVQGLNFTVNLAEDMLRNYPVGFSYRIMRCLKNSRYNIHSAGAKV